jgi:RNA polymerase sigma factor for flagellar operon FliA
MASSPAERQRLVETHLSFVRSVAAKVKEQLPREIEFDDLVSYGTQGLIEAAERYDPAHGTAFTTFSYYRIRGAIFDGLRGMGWLPRGEYARARFEERSNAYLQNLADRETGTAAEDREELTLEDDVRSIADALGGVAAIFVMALDALPDEPADGAPRPEQLVEDEQQRRVVREALASLPEKERRLLELYYFEDKSLNDAGEALGLSKSWASRLHARAVTLLKASLERGGVLPNEAELPDDLPFKPGRARR